LGGYGTEYFVYTRYVKKVDTGVFWV
jgi:hypothetical protein